MLTKITKTAGVSMFISLAFVFSFSVSTVNAVEVVPQAESSIALCEDGFDNDDNGSTDAADANCAAFLVEAQVVPEPQLVPENSFALCHDSIDNDDNGSADMADVNCANFENPPAQEEEETSSRRNGSKKRVPTGNLSSGEVLGASTDADSCPMITSFMKEGQSNDMDQVKLLQSFLNTHLGISLPTTGFFGALTNKAVEDFQLKYKDDVLKPWVDLGLHTNVDVPTGYVYQTTTYKINTILCPDADISAPVLN